MSLTKKKETKVGDEFGKHTTKAQIKKLIVKYGLMLKRSYFPKQDKRSIEEKMIDLKQELQKLEEEEKYFGMQKSVAEKKAKIKEMKPQSIISKILNSSSSSSSPKYLTEVPDVLNSGFGRNIKIKPFGD